jgi:glycosyltransferase involved in cell wall biosynthesis
MVAEAIGAILVQTFRDFELIVIDDCSVDDTEKVIKAFTDARIRYLVHDSGGRVAVNRNFGMSQAGGEYIAFCDDDDIWLPDKLEKQLKEFEKDGSLGIVCTNAIRFNETGDLGVYNQAGLPESKFTFRSLLRTNTIICSSVVVGKQVIDNVGGMDTGPVFVTSEDYELWLRIVRRYRIKYIDLPLVRYRVHTGNIAPKGIAAMKHRRDVYRHLLAKGFIGRSLFWRLVLWTLSIEFLLRTRIIAPASWLWGRIRKIMRS